MAYVQLLEDGTVNGIFANAQPDLEGYAEIEDDDPRIPEFEARQNAVFEAQKPTLASLQAQLAILTAQMAALVAEGNAQ